MKRPHVIVNVAATVNGIIGQKGRQLKLSNEQDVLRVHNLRASVDAVMVGSKTVLSDNPQLTVRNVKGHNPTRIVIDSMLKTPVNYHVCDNEAPTIFCAVKKASRMKVKQLESKGNDVLIFAENKVDLAQLLSVLKQRGYEKILVEGGGELIAMLLSQDLVDEVYVTMCPQLLGSGISIVNGALPKPFDLDLVGIQQLEDQAVLHYQKK